ncbi:MAG: hypothetical protein BGO09_06280 [Bacteroidetes bacterium 47-18]|nr:MAG: hypothetical protein BGO09_06280 [Bacteroidetes bacterium 47-18]
MELLLPHNIGDGCFKFLRDGHKGIYLWDTDGNGGAATADTERRATLIFMPVVLVRGYAVICDMGGHRPAFLRITTGKTGKHLHQQT